MALMPYTGNKGSDQPAFAVWSWPSFRINKYKRRWRKTEKALVRLHWWLADLHLWCWYFFLVSVHLHVFMGNRHIFRERKSFVLTSWFLPPFWKGVYSKRKEFAPNGSKFFSYRVEHIQSYGNKFFPYKVDHLQPYGSKFSPYRVDHIQPYGSKFFPYRVDHNTALWE